MITCRNATLDEVTTVLDWAAEEGWNPGLDDAAAFFQADLEGFFVAEDRSEGPIAAISVVNHTDSFAFLGLYLVRPEHRGKGVGLLLWQYAIQHAGDRTVGLDGVEAQQQNYVASGFVHAGGTTRFTGSPPRKADPDVRLATEGDIAALTTMEGKASGVEKPAYLRSWLIQSEHRTTLVCETAQGITGFATVRTCRTGAKLGPLVADDVHVADRLIKHAASLIDGPLTIDVPKTSNALGTLCDSYGMEAGFRTARMYRGPFDAPPAEIFAVTSLELG